MPITDPRHLNDHYNMLFRQGDLDGLVSLYEEDAVLCPEPGLQIKGRAEIKKRLGGLIALKGTLSATQQSCVEFENFALLQAHWQFVGSTGDGQPIRMGATSTKLARRGVDGQWRYVLDLPAGGLPPPAQPG
jgi:ketosteroid isomerase-like protein